MRDFLSHIIFFNVVVSFLFLILCKQALFTTMAPINVTIAALAATIAALAGNADAFSSSSYQNEVIRQMPDMIFGTSLRKV